MAEINKLGNIVACCPGCDGGKSTFEYQVGGKSLGVTKNKKRKPYTQSREETDVQYRLFRCAGCGRGAIGTIRMQALGAEYPDGLGSLIGFFPEAKLRLPIPSFVPKEIENEFREAEICMEANCFRAAAAMFRSVLDKVLRANGYRTDQEKNLKQQIDAAEKDRVITESRKKKAHEDVRVLGNDVLHDEWRELKEEDVLPAQHYTQRILEDFYDDRESIVKLLKEAGRKPIGETHKKKGAT